MHLKVSIDVTVPLKKEWCVRARNGEFVTVEFKYEKLGVFCHRCGVIWHTDKVCPDLFELDADDGVRNWGPSLKPASHRVGTAATNRWLQDPIPAAIPQHTQGAAAASAGRDLHGEGISNTTNFHDRMAAFQTQLTAMRHDVLTAQNSVLAKRGNGAHAICKVNLLPSSSTGTSASNLLQDRPLVLGLPAAPFSSESDASAHEENGSEAKKRKRMLALQNGEPFAADGEMGNNVIGPNVSHGGDLEMHVVSNPLFAENNVPAGPVDEACPDK